MKKIKGQAFLILSLTLLILAFSQSAGAQPGTIKGTIYIKELSGNNAYKLTCQNFVVIMKWTIPGGPPRTVVEKTQGEGDFSKRKCSYSISVHADRSIEPSIKADNSMPFDQKSLEAYDPNLKLKVKPNKMFAFNFTVKKISCVLLK